ncbi:MAG: chorismate lyase [Sulfuricella sp.]|nr:chorismate lyase [Sulfuricella sp.]
MKSDSITLRWPPRLTESQGRFRPWLLDRGSLTWRIQARCAAFSVRRVRQSRGMAMPSERHAVGLGAHDRALLRDVFLYCGETPLVFAHSVLPAASLGGSWQGLGRLGDKPLGAALFSNPKVRRTPLHFKKLNRRNALYQAACAVLPEPPTHLWARRSVFTLLGRPILVTEVFLPGILGLAP